MLLQEVSAAGMPVNNENRTSYNCQKYSKDEVDNVVGGVSMRGVRKYDLSLFEATKRCVAESIVKILLLVSV